jgi:hypothetical protein
MRTKATPRYDAAYSRAARLQPHPVRCTNHKRGKFVVAWMRVGGRLYCHACYQFLTRAEDIAAGVKRARRYR